MTKEHVLRDHERTFGERRFRLFPIDEARLLPGWIDHNEALFEVACELAKTRWPASTN